MSKPATETRSVVVERELPHPPAKIWRALTQGAPIEEWLMKNDFEPVVGRRFNLRADWGAVDCQVLAVEPNNTLSYTWAAYGLASVVTWTLAPTEPTCASSSRASGRISNRPTRAPRAGGSTSLQTWSLSSRGWAERAPAELPRSPLRVRREDVVAVSAPPCGTRTRISRRSPAAAGRPRGGPERIGRGVVLEHGLSPSAAVRELLAVLHHEIDVVLEPGTSARLAPLPRLRYPMDFRHLRAVRKGLAVAGNAARYAATIEGFPTITAAARRRSADRDDLPVLVPSEVGEREAIRDRTVFRSCAEMAMLA